MCENCHGKVRKDAAAARAPGRMKKGTKKKHAGASVLNQIMPKLLQNLEARYPAAAAEGWQTKAFSDAHRIGKAHDADVYCIACSALDAQTVFDAPREPYAVKQYRRHDRARIKVRTN